MGVEGERNYINRDLEARVLPWLEEKEIVAIRGPRQAGKTTFVNHLSKVLVSKGVVEENIHYISFEDTFEKEKLEKDPKQYVSFFIKSSKRNYFIFDEVQYVKDAGHILKLIYDSFKNIKIIITGSSSLDLNKVGSYLVGRIVFFELYPFSFGEFLSVKNKKIFEHYIDFKVDIHNLKEGHIKQSIFLNELNKYLKEYLLYGGYPRVVLEKDTEKKKILLRNLFYTYVEKDIVNLYGLQYKDKVVKLLKYLAGCISDIIIFEDIVKNSGLYFEEIKKILPILEDTYVVKRITPFYRNKIKELRKNPKIYFLDCGIRNILLDSFNANDSIDYGKLLENFVFIILMGRSQSFNFWKTVNKAEIDFVVSNKNSLIGIEVKKTARTSKGLWSFYSEYNPKYILLTDLNQYDIVKNDNKIIYVLPIVML